MTRPDETIAAGSMSAGRHEVTPSRMRAAIARRMSHSKQQVPHFYVSADLEMDAVLAAADRLNTDRPREERVSLTAFLVRALADVLPRHPAFNAVWREDGMLEHVDAVNIGVAIAVEDGLIAPALLDCSGRSVDDIGSALRDLVERTRAGKLRAAEINDATFTLSNLGMYDVSSFTAIINPPQVAILATAKTEPHAVVRDGQIVVRQIMTATLSADHRAVDGVGAAQLLADLREALASPAP
jgi:pyruvate dehydrogenase E2 component (dihydrolipoamide acetyltransferase)